MDKCKELGKKGEELAANYLKNLGWMILARNERLGNLEIDIIASYKGKMIFIEVKTRLKSETNNNDPMLYRRQIDNLKRAIVIYALKNRVSLDAVYLDLIIIEADHQTGCASLKHYPDII